MPKTIKSSFVFGLYFVLIPIISLSGAYLSEHIFTAAGPFWGWIFHYSILPAVIIIVTAGWDIHFFNPGGGIQIIPAFIGLLSNFAFGFVFALAVTETIRTFFPTSPTEQQ